jgi:RHS repeat-associated protein
MKMRSMLQLTFWSILILSGSAASQSGGHQPSSTYFNGLEDIVTPRDALHLTLPVVKKAGRGMNFSYVLNWDLFDVWNISGNGTVEPQTGPDALPMWGWIEPGTSAVFGLRSTTPENCLLGYWEGSQYPATTHLFQETCSGQAAVAYDESGYTLTASGQFFDRSGNLIVAPAFPFNGNPNTQPGSITDPNGNKIFTTDGLNYMDTTGSKVLSISGTNPISYTYKGPGGTPRAVKVYYKSYPITSNFSNCGQYTDYSTNANLVDSISLPDTSSYHFKYQPTTQNSANVTARISEIDLPTGGSIKYQYDQCGTVMTRTTSDGAVWTYEPFIPSGSTATIDPAGNYTVFNFANGVEYQRSLYAGNPTPTNPPLETTYTCTAYRVPGTVTSGVAQKIVFTTNKANQTSAVQTFYNDYGMLTEQDEFDYGVPITCTDSLGTPARTTKISYASPGTSIFDRPACVQVTAGAGPTTCGTVTSNTVSLTNYSKYDSLGNVETVQNWVSGSTFLNSSFTYYPTGLLKTSTDVNGTQASYAYQNCNNTQAYLSSITSGGLSSSMTWDCNGGAITSTTDANSQPTTYGYTDPLWRLTSVTDPESNVTNFKYPDPNHPEGILNFNGSVSTADTTTTTDGLGRPILVQKRQAQGSSSFDSVQYQYGWTNGSGAFMKQSLPYSGSPVAWTTTRYDAIGRVSTVTDGGGNTVTTYTYSGNDVLIDVTAPSGENHKKRQLEYDGLGRLTSVCEIAVVSITGCTQSSPITNGYWTQYAYGTNTLSVTQNSQGSTTETRNYYYDGLGRLTKEINPESGTTQYFWDAAPPVCYNNVGWSTPGDLGAKLDNAGIYTCYGYDALHRVAGLLHTNGTQGVGGCTGFGYDTLTPPPGVTVQNAKGRLIEAYTNNDCKGTQNVVTDEWFSYSLRGEATDIYTKTPNSNGYYHITKQYWANGVVSQLSGLPGVPTISYGVDGEGRWNTVSAGSGQNPVTQSSYNPAARVTSVTYGSGDSDTYQYDANTGRMTQYAFSVNSQSVIAKQTWNANGTLKTFQVTQDPFNPPNVQTCNYGYDDLARVSSAGCGSAWAQNFSYDAFGNISKTGNLSFQPTYNSANQYQSLPGCTPKYDSDGHLTDDSFHSYQWDANGHVTFVSSSACVPQSPPTSTQTFDAFGHIVEISQQNWLAQYLYDENGLELGDSQAQGSAFAKIPLPGGGTAIYSGGSLQSYGHVDWLGSSRLTSTPARAATGENARAPFGEPYAVLNTVPNQSYFASLDQNIATDLYDTQNREYQTKQGRWITPDPAGLAAADPSNPQTWNRYAYALNNPLSNTDPTGLDGCQEGTDGSDYNCSVSTDIANSDSSGSGDQPWWSGGQLNLSAIPAGYSGPLGGGYYWQNGYLGLLSSSAGSSSPTTPGTTTSATSGSSGQGSPLPNGDVTVGRDIFHNSAQCPNCGTLWNNAAGTMNALTAVYAGGFAAAVAGPAVYSTGINIAARGVGWYYGLFGSGAGVVLGEYNAQTNYVDAAESMGANALNLGPRAYNFFNGAGQWWILNRAFLNGSILRGQQFFMSSPVLGATDNFALELQHLLSKGIGPEQWQMVPLPY